MSSVNFGKILLILSVGSIDSSTSERDPPWTHCISLFCISNLLEYCRELMLAGKFFRTASFHGSICSFVLFLALSFTTFMVWLRFVLVCWDVTSPLTSVVVIVASNYVVIVLYLGVLCPIRPQFAVAALLYVCDVAIWRHLNIWRHFEVSGVVWNI